MTGRRAAFSVLLIAAFLLLLVWQLLPPSSPPLYDGLGLPMEQYHYLSPPKGIIGNKLPSEAKGETRQESGVWPLSIISTREQPPQASLVLKTYSFGVPAGTPVEITIKAVQPQGGPNDGRVDGNVYRFSAAKPDGSPARLTGTGSVFVELRTTTKLDVPILEQYTGGQWVRRATSFFTGGNYRIARVKSLGDFALVLPGNVPKKSSSTSILPFVIAGVAILVLLAVALVLIRLNRQRMAGDDADDATLGEGGTDGP